MKKILILMSVLVVFYSCGFGGAFKDDPEFTAMVGVLSAQSANDNFGGTHLLTDELGVINPVRSLSINLDSQEYLGSKIEALGIMNSDDEVFEITGISILEKLNTDVSSDSMLNYRNTDFGIEFDYPSSWDFEVSDSVLTFYPVVQEFPSTNGSTKIIFEQEIFNYSPNLDESGTMDSPLEAYFNTLSGGSLGSQTSSKVGVDALDSVREEFPDGTVVFYLYRSGLIYKVSYVPTSDSILDDEIVFNDIISSFRFIGFDLQIPSGDEDSALDVIDAAGVSVDSEVLVTGDFSGFESLPYHFAGIYPKSWYYAGKNGSGGEVLHHYGFSDESIKEGNELISLDVVPTLAKLGSAKLVNGKELFMQSSSDSITVSIQVGDLNFRLQGPVDYKDIIVSMALGLHTISAEDSVQN